MTEQLSALDAGFLEVEDSDLHVSLAIGGLAIMAGPMPDFDVLLNSLGEKVKSAPRCTQVLRTHPLDIRAPEWVEDPQFDISRHIRRAALPNPGDDRALFDFVADTMERRLDRSRPLWECLVIEGLAGDRWALLMKVHHSIADGVAATNLLTTFSDDATTETFAGDLRAGLESHSEPINWRPSLNPLNWVGDSWRLSTSLAKTASQVVAGAVELTTGILRPAEPSSLIGPVSDLRRYSGARVALEDVKTISRVFDVTINDVALAAISDSYRDALLRRGEEPRAGSVRTLVPVSVRTSAAMHRPDNQVSAMLPLLPVDEPCPVLRLRKVHERMTRVKGSGERDAGNLLWSAVRLLPFAFSAWTLRLLATLPQRGVTTVTTNVPGPRKRLRVMGCEVEQILPIPPIALGLRTAVAILSYADTLEFGITADYDTVPDIDEFAHGIERGVELLLSACPPGVRRGKGHLKLLSG